MEFVYPDSKRFTKILKAIETLTNEATFKVNQDGLTVKEMDPSRISMVVVNMPKYVFEEWWIDQPESFCIDARSILNTVFKNLQKDETVKVERTSDNLLVTLRGDYDRVSELPILESSEMEAPEPKIKLDAVIRMISKDFANICVDADRYSDYLAIETTSQKTVEFQAQNEVSKFKVPLYLTSGPILNIDSLDKARASYGLGYLGDLAKSMKNLAEVVTIQYGHEMPLKLTAELEGAEISYYLAPRIED